MLFSSAPPRVARAVVTRDRGINTIVVEWACEGVNGLLLRPSSYDASWLFANCPTHRQSGSGQRLLPATALAATPELRAATVEHGGDTVRIAWADGSSAPFAASWLAHYDYGFDALSRAAVRASPPCLTEVTSAARGYHVIGSAARRVPLGKDGIPTYEYDELVSSDAATLRWLYDINKWGLTLVRRAPTADGTVLRLASRIARPMWTIYGESWDVEVQPGVAPINIAYTPASLDLHVDLAYYESPPGLQMLACRAFDDDVVGGESTFVDGFFAAEELRRRNPEAFSVLTRVPATFCKVHYDRSEPVHIIRQRPHIGVAMSLLPGGVEPVTSIAWAPPFEGPLRVLHDDARAYYGAYTQFAKLLEDFDLRGEHFIEFRLAPGDAVVFNNRRMLHGRRHFYTNDTRKHSAFATTVPKRSLQGCYISSDDWASRLVTLSAKLGVDRTDRYRTGDGQVELL